MLDSHHARTLSSKRRSYPVIIRPRASWRNATAPLSASSSPIAAGWSAAPLRAGCARPAKSMSGTSVLTGGTEWARLLRRMAARYSAPAFSSSYLFGHVVQPQGVGDAAKPLRSIPAAHLRLRAGCHEPATGPREVHRRSEAQAVRASQRVLHLRRIRQPDRLGDAGRPVDPDPPAAAAHQDRLPPGR